MKDRKSLEKEFEKDKISDNRLIKINKPRSVSDKNQYNKLINNIIFNNSSNLVSAII